MYLTASLVFLTLFLWYAWRLRYTGKRLVVIRDDERLRAHHRALNRLLVCLVFAIASLYAWTHYDGDPYRVERIVLVTHRFLCVFWFAILLFNMLLFNGSKDPRMHRVFNRILFFTGIGLAITGVGIGVESHPTVLHSLGIR